MKTGYRSFFLVFYLLMLPFLAVAQPAGVTEATYQVSQNYDTFKKVGKAMAAICGVLGASRVYSKFSMGDPSAVRSLLNWMFAVIFCLYFPYVVDLLFL